jgi:hypothetical protein
MHELGEVHNNPRSKGRAAQSAAGAAWMYAQTVLGGKSDNGLDVRSIPGVGHSRRCLLKNAPVSGQQVAPHTIGVKFAFQTVR